MIFSQKGMPAARLPIPSRTFITSVHIEDTKHITLQRCGTHSEAGDIIPIPEFSVRTNPV